jgi:hypothetical protein
MILISKLMTRLFLKAKPAPVPTPSKPLPDYLKRHAEAQERGDFRP